MVDSVLGLATAALDYAVALGLSMFIYSLGFTETSLLSENNLYSRLVDPNSSGSWLVFILIVFTLIFRATIKWLSSGHRHYYALSLRAQLRRRLVDNVPFANNHNTKELNATFTEIAAAASDSLFHLQGFFQNLMTSLPIAIFLVSKDWMFFITVTCTTVPFLPLLFFLNRQIAKRSYQYQEELAKLIRRFNRLLNSARFLTIHGHWANEAKVAQSEIETQRSRLLALRNYVSSSAPMLELIGILAVLGGLTALKKLNLIDDHAQIIESLYLYWRLSSTAGWCYNHGANAIANSVALKKAADVLGAPSLAPLHPDEISAQDKGPLGWRLKSLSFRYPASPQPDSFKTAEDKLIDQLTLDIPPGSFMGIAGPSGSGKTTLIDLLLGRLAPDSGDIEIYTRHKALGRNINIHKACSYLDAEIYVFPGTILENLTFGLDTAPNENEIHKALQVSQCSFLLKRPDIMQDCTPLEQLHFSKGELQRLGLARALLRRPSVLILDEATCFLDKGTEIQIARALHDLKGVMTIIASSHREEFLRETDSVLRL